MSGLSLGDLLPEVDFAHKTYPRATLIDGVELLPLKRFVDDRGLFMELYRNAVTTEGSADVVAFFENVTLAQINFSVVTAEEHVKGLHFHLKQADVWFCPPPSKMKVVLFDLRANSPTAGLTQVVILGEGRDALVKIPPGVAHGYRPLTVPCSLFYLVTRCFDVNDPDEYRVPWDHPSVRELWDIRKE